MALLEGAEAGTEAEDAVGENAKEVGDAYICAAVVNLHIRCIELSLAPRRVEYAARSCVPCVAWHAAAREHQHDPPVWQAEPACRVIHRVRSPHGG